MSTATAYTHELPPPDECTIAIATPAQSEEMWEAVRPAFAGRRTPEDFRGIMQHVVNAKYSQDGRLFAWVLVDRKNPERAYSYVETIRRDAWIKDTEGIHDTEIYGTMVVVTPEKYRRRGYCHRLLRMFHYILAPPENIGAWPTSWGPKLELPAETKAQLPPGSMTYLSSMAPKGFYEAALVGPNEDERQGWITRPHENDEVVWNVVVPKSQPTSQDNSPLHSQFIYQGDLDTLGIEIAKIHKEILSNTPLSNPNQSIIRLNPASQSVLHFVNPHAANGMDNLRPLVPDDQPVGIRWSTEEEGVAFKSTDPLVLFWPDGLLPEELLIALVVNVTKENVEQIGNDLTKHSISIDHMKWRIFDMTEKDVLAAELIARGGATAQSRMDTYWLPNGVCWYGPKGTECRVDGMEAWTWL